MPLGRWFLPQIITDVLFSTNKFIAGILRKISGWSITKNPISSIGIELSRISDFIRSCRFLVVIVALFSKRMVFLIMANFYNKYTRISPIKIMVFRNSTNQLSPVRKNHSQSL